MKKRKYKKIIMIISYSVVLIILSFLFCRREQSIKNYNKDIMKKKVYLMNCNIEKGDKIIKKMLWV